MTITAAPDRSCPDRFQPEGSDPRNCADLAQSQFFGFASTRCALSPGTTCPASLPQSRKGQLLRSMMAGVAAAAVATAALLGQLALTWKRSPKVIGAPYGIWYSVEPPPVASAAPVR